MKLPELKALCIKAIETAEAHERKMGKDKLIALLYKETQLGKLQILFSELSEQLAMHNYGILLMMTQSLVKNKFFITCYF